jgi:hypothetical protein
MLYLSPPFFMIKGIIIYRDHADINQYYYMPAAPRFRTTLDTATGRRIPRLSLIAYRSTAIGGGGFLDFDVHLGLDDDELDALRSELKTQLRKEGIDADNPRLAPVPVTGGSVRLFLFSSESQGTLPPSTTPAPAPLGGPTAPAAPAPPPLFVVKAVHNAKPSLYGDNGAAFSVRLDEFGVAVMKKALDGEMSPILISYALDYVALRPSYSVRLKIDWDRTQSFLNEEFKTETLFSSTDIQKATDKLIDRKFIEFEADNFVPDAEDGGNTAKAMEEAKNRVLDMITDSFFESSLLPMKRREDGWDRAADTIKDVGKMAMQTALFGGFIGSFKYKKEDYTRIDKKRLDVRFNERAAVLRTIYPQGHLDGLFKLQQAGEPKSRFITEVDADDPFFKRRKVRVINRADMAEDSIRSVHAILRYGNNTQDILLDQPDAEKTLEWLSILDNGAVKPDVDIDYSVNFKGVQNAERPIKLQSKRATVTQDVIEIFPRELYSIIRVPVFAFDNFPWARFPNVQIELVYEDADKNIRMVDTVQLKKDAMSTNWSFFVLDPAKRSFRYRITYRAANNADIVLPWTETDTEQVYVSDPAAGALRLKLEVVPVVSKWDDVEFLFVELTYEDSANNVFATDSFTFTPTDKAPKTFTVDLRDANKRFVAFKVTSVLRGGLTLEVPKSYTMGTRLLVRPDMRGQRIVNIAAPANFIAARLERVDAELRYVDNNNGLQFGDRFTLTGLGARKAFEFQYMDTARDDYEWRATYVFANGMTRSVDWTAAESLELTLPNA